MKTRTLKIQELNSDNVAPYGTLVDTALAEPTVAGDEFSFWNELAVDDTQGAVSVGIVEARPNELKATTFERHTATGELLAPLNGDVILVLGEATEANAPNLERFGAFRLPPGSALLLKSGTWHYAPLVEEQPVKVLVVFRKGTSDSDMELHEIDKELNSVFHVVA